MTADVYGYTIYVYYVISVCSAREQRERWRLPYRLGLNPWIRRQGVACTRYVHTLSNVLLQPLGHFSVSLESAVYGRVDEPENLNCVRNCVHLLMCCDHLRGRDLGAGGCGRASSLSRPRG